MIILTAGFPDNLYTSRLLKFKKIPCFCRVGDEFEVEFTDPLVPIVGKVTDWDDAKVNLSVPTMVGGRYSQYGHSLITMTKIGEDRYSIDELSIFSRALGWCEVIVEGDYAPPHESWEVDDV